MITAFRVFAKFMKALLRMNELNPLDKSKKQSYLNFSLREKITAFRKNNTGDVQINGCVYRMLFCWTSFVDYGVIRKVSCSTSKF